jgi:RNA polymerase sigma-70 factor, ECF subfamily
VSRALDQAARQAGARIRAALAARFRDLDLAEDGWAEACARAAARWPNEGTPADPAAWLYRTAERAALDLIRRAEVRGRLAPPAPEPEPTPEDEMLGDHRLIPDERLRLIFVCCHPAIAQAFLVPEATLAQRLVRAKRKIAEAGVPFEVPAPVHWRERLEAVLTTMEIAYARAHEDAAGTGAHAGFAPEMLALTATLAELMPDEPDAHALAATIRFAEARRPARTDAAGLMVPLSEQDPARWDAQLIASGRTFLRRADWPSRRALQAQLHAAWCNRISLADPPPWCTILKLYDRLLEVQDDAVVRINRAVALAEVAGPEQALAELDGLDHPGLARFTPWLAARADLLRRAGRVEEAGAAYGTLLAQDLPEAERRWLQARLNTLSSPRATSTSSGQT